MAGFMRSMMTSITLIPDDLLDMPGGDRRYELVNGRLVELEMDMMSRYVAARLGRWLGNSFEVSGFAHVIIG